MSCAPVDAELLADRLWALGASAVAEQAVGAGGTTAAAVTARDPTLPCGPAGPEWVTLVADLTPAGLDRLRPMASSALAFTLRTVEVDPAWATAWREHAGVWRAGPFVVRPPWVEVPAAPAGGTVVAASGEGTASGEVAASGEGTASGEVAAGPDGIELVVDPGDAFGSGSHPTTRLCLEALEALALESTAGAGGSLAGLRVADLGCGSGILAIAALRLGAIAVAAADTDSLAVRATTANAALNDLPVEVAQGSLETLANLLDRRPADVLLCNILAPVIEALCPGFHRLLAPGGVGFLSGLLVDQAPALVRALAEAGWRAELRARQDPWALLTIREMATGVDPVA